MINQMSNQMNKPTNAAENRREVKSRSVQAFHRLAFRLVKLGLTPNQVSVLSSVFAGLGALCLWAASRSLHFPTQLALLLGALLGIQLRLVCNLIDGLMAVEGGKKTAYGEFFNDFPDRISDLALLVAAGYALLPVFPHGPSLAWAAAVAAVLTAYIRVLGTGMGAPARFLGPMAKQHRMAALNLAILASIAEAYAWQHFSIGLRVALWVILLGSVVTCLRRARALLAHFGQA